MSTFTYKCPNCGSGLTFNPEEKRFDCDYCLSTFSEDEIKNQFANETLDSKTEEQSPSQEKPEIDSNTQDVSDSYKEFEEHANLYSCPSCGAEVIGTDTTAATFCIYCHNPVVLSGRLSGDFKPDKIIPFSVSEESAKEGFLNWVKKKWFVKSDFYSASTIEKITGVYFPFWLIDTEGSASLSGKGQKLRVWRLGDTEYTETSVFEVVRDGDLSLKNITLKALSKDDAKMLSGILPFNINELKEFSMPFLTGFLAEKRNLSKEDLNDNAKSIMKNASSNLLNETVSGYSSFSPRESKFHSKNETWNYALMPVWTLIYKYNGELYYFVMNGQTKKIAGRVPVSNAKLIALFFIIFVVVFLLFFIIGGLI